MENFLEETLDSHIAISTKARLRFSYQSGISCGILNMIFEFYFNGIFSNWVQKLTLSVMYFVMVCQFKFPSKVFENSNLICFMIGEFFQVLLLFLSYHLHPYYLMIWAQMSAIALVNYQSFLCTTLWSSLLLSIKHTIFWVCTMIYYDNFEFKNIVCFISATFWLFAGIFECTYFEYLKEKDIIRSKYKVKQANDKISSILETLEESIIVLSREKGLLYNNTSANQFLSGSDIFHTLSSYKYYKYTSGIPQEEISSLIMKSFNNPVGSSSNYGVLEKEGIFIELQSKVIKWDDANVVMLVGKNITKIIELEKEKRQNSYKSVLINTVSHELRTPTNSILTVGKIVLDSNDLSKKNEERLQVMMSSCAYQLCLINDLLDYAQIVAGTLKVCRVPFNIYSLLSECYTYIEPQLGPQIKLIKKIGSIPDLIKSDQNRLKQVILNLIGNARKFTLKGTIELQIDYISPNLKISCKDTGIGIPKEKISKLFKEFSKLEDSESINQQGVGLGLVISNMLVKSLGGEGIYVTSEPGVGSTFEFFIKAPAKQINETFKCQVSNLYVPTEKFMNSKILLVDDIYFNILAYQEILKAEGIICEYAMNGEQAIEMIKNQIFNCVLMDCEMPILDGWSTTKKLKEMRLLGELKSIPPIIGTSASNDDETIRKCFAYGMDDVISKPCSRENLIKVLSFWL